MTSAADCANTRADAAPPPAARAAAAPARAPAAAAPPAARAAGTSAGSRAPPPARRRAAPRLEPLDSALERILGRAAGAATAPARARLRQHPAGRSADEPQLKRSAPRRAAARGRIPRAGRRSRRPGSCSRVTRQHALAAGHLQRIADQIRARCRRVRRPRPQRATAARPCATCACQMRSCRSRHSVSATGQGLKARTWRRSARRSAPQSMRASRLSILAA